MVVFGVSFQSIMDHAKMTEGILSASQRGAKKARCLVSIGVRPLEVDILEVLMDTMVGQWRLYRV